MEGSDVADSFESRELLELVLGLHPEAGEMADGGFWDYLSMRDLMAVYGISKSLRGRLRRFEYRYCRDGQNYWLEYPGVPGILRTPKDISDGAGLFPHQLASLHSMHQLEHRSKQFGDLRGGILGDAPGLGKTITMLSLIANTAGQRTVNPPEFWDEQGLAEGWSLKRAQDHLMSEFLYLLKPIRTWIEDHFDTRLSAEYTHYRNILSYITPSEEYRRENRFPTIQSLERFVLKSFRSYVPRGILEQMRSRFTHYKASLDKKQRKALMGPYGARLKQERLLLPSSATLIIVPDALLEHWFQQIHEHMDLTRFQDEISNMVEENMSATATASSAQALPKRPASSSLDGIVYLDGIGDFSRLSLPLKAAANRSSNLVTSQRLAQYVIVITTFSRIKEEFQREVRSGRWESINSNTKSSSNGGRKRRASFGENDNDHSMEAAVSPLLAVRWLRVVVDEGHELGTHETGTEVTQFIHQIAAERRWVLSGTPTTGDEDDVAFSSHALDQLQRLLLFLRHPRYGNLPTETPLYKSYASNSEVNESKKKRQAKVVAQQQWLDNVKSPFLQRKAEGRQELERVLREILVIHRKEDLQLPKPIFRQAEVNVSVPMDIQQRLLEEPHLSELRLHEYLHTEAYQSKVDEAQAKYIVDTLQQARSELERRGGAIETLTTAGFFHETYDQSKDRRPIKAVVYSSDQNNLLDVTEYLYHKLASENLAELYSDMSVQAMGAELSRFRHGFKEVRKCPICQRDNDYEGNEHQKCQNTLLEVVEIVDGDDDDRAPRRFLIEPERIKSVLEWQANMEGYSIADYASHQRFWRTGDVLQVDIRNDHPLLPERLSEEKWKEFGSDDCKQLAEDMQHLGVDWYFGPLPAPSNSGVGSRNQPGRPPSNTMTVRFYKWQKCHKYHNPGRWYLGPTLAQAPVRRLNESVFLLSLHADLSHGLDLSFVTHMFLLEPITDAALLEQVTSRAHRLGAKGPVKVDTVNVFYTLDPQIQGTLEQVEQTFSPRRKNSSNLSKKTLEEEKSKTLTSVCCAYCYRAFRSYKEANHHEANSCPRNPDITSVLDPFHLSSVYRDIKPPPAIPTKPQQAQSVTRDLS